MNWALAWQIARRFRRSKQRNRFISFISASSVVGIAVGVAATILLLGVMNGFEGALKDRLLTLLPHIQYRAIHPPIDDWQQVAARLTAHPQVEGVAPFIRFSAMVERRGQLRALELRGIDPVFEQRVSGLFNFLQPADAPPLAGEQLWLGSGIAEALGVTTGDRVIVHLPRFSDDGELGTPQRQLFTVTATIHMGGQFDDTLALIHLGDARRLAGWKEGVQGVQVKIEDVLNASALSREIGRNLKEPMYVEDWTRSQGHLYEDIQMVRTIIQLVAVLVIVVASFNIVATLVMTVEEKQSAIAVLRTCGARRRLIMAIFVLQGLLGGIIGTIAGVIAGLLLAAGLPPAVEAWVALTGKELLDPQIYFVDTLPVAVQLEDVLVAIAAALGASVLATLYPAWQATRVAPALVLGGKA
ncbi:MAG: lipoprotein-releasing ABC transporter permease subunit [Gammaproteobacteria bacterium]|nr:lipoprotein-releasing ABC transporter permease subunit [Gammaproteobacteria bacterium]